MNSEKISGIVVDAGHQGIGVSQIWWIAIKTSKYKRFKVLLIKVSFIMLLVKKIYKIDDIMYIGDKNVRRFIK